MFEMAYPTFKINKPIRLIELFAGVGSQAMALRNLGADFEHHKVVEFDKYAIASYNAIHDTNFETMDITKVKGIDLEITNTDRYDYILTYSFPCQDLSVAGNQQGMSRGSGTRSGLLWEVERLLNETEHLPQILLMENVPQVISQANIADFHEWQKFLEEKGYSNYVDTLNAKDYGVAQNRNRTFMVSILGEWYYEFPKPKKLTKTIQDIADFKTEVPRKNLYSYYKKTGDFGDRFNTQETISPCVTTKHGYGVITNNYYTKDFKKYTIEEIIEKDIPVYANSPNMDWRLMGFTDEDFYKAEKVNSNSQLYKQAGNSIVVDVLEGIFRQML